MPYVFRQDDLPKLDIQIDRGSDYAAWQAQLESYMSLSRLSEESADKNRLCFSRETLFIIQNLGLSDAEKTDVAAILSAMKKIYERPH